MRELSGRRKRVVGTGAVVCSMSALVVATARHSLWVALPCIAVEVVALVFMLREVMAMQRGE
jgi:hypothetical protein